MCLLCPVGPEYVLNLLLIKSDGIELKNHDLFSAACCLRYETVNVSAYVGAKEWCCGGSLIGAGELYLWLGLDTLLEWRIVGISLDGMTILRFPVVVLRMVCLGRWMILTGPQRAV